MDLRFRVFFSDPESSLMDIENIVDRIEIENFFSRYARAVDDRDW